MTRALCIRLHLAIGPVVLPTYVCMYVRILLFMERGASKHCKLGGILRWTCGCVLWVTLSVGYVGFLEIYYAGIKCDKV